LDGLVGMVSSSGFFFLIGERSGLGLRDKLRLLESEGDVLFSRLAIGGGDAGVRSLLLLGDVRLPLAIGDLLLWRWSLSRKSLSLLR